jgi:hypothetical protein
MAEDKNVPVNFIDNPNAPEIHSTGYAGLWVHGGNLHITFAAGRYNHGFNPGEINNVVNGRLVMPIEQARQLGENILTYLKNPRSAPPEVPMGSFH